MLLHSIRQLPLLLILFCLVGSAPPRSVQDPSQGSFDGPWVGAFEYMEQRYDMTIRQEADGIVLHSSLLRNVALLDYASTGGTVTCRFVRNDTGPVDLRFTVEDGVARGGAFAGPQQFLVISMVRQESVSPAELKSVTGTYQFEEGPPLVVYGKGRADSSLFVSRHAAGVEQALLPHGRGRFLAGLALEGEHVADLQLQFQGDEVQRIQDGMESTGVRTLEIPVPPLVTIEAAMRNAMADSDIPSLSIGLVHRGELVLSKSLGHADRAAKTPATPQTLYQLGSVMKPLTATLMASLVAEGRMDWDTPIERYLPEGVRLESVDRETAGLITPRRLANHTSGLQRDSRLLRSVTSGPNVGHLHQAIARAQLTHNVGAEHIYSNLGMKILGHAIETTAGETLENVLQERLLAPLGMAATTSVLSDEVEERLAVHYWPDNPTAPQQPVRFGVATGAGGLISNVEDMAKFLSWQLGYGPSDARLIDPLSRQQMYALTLANGDAGQGVGHTWSVRILPGAERIVSHGGESNGHSAWIAFSPEHQVGVVVLANMGGAGIFDFASWLMSTWIEARRAAATPSLHDALRAASEHRHADAAWAYRFQTKANPGNGNAWLRLGHAHFGLGQLAKASECFEKAVSLEHRAAESHHMLAKIHAARQETEQCLEQLTLAFEAGWAGRFNTRRAPEFQSLVGTPEWEAIVARK